MNCEKCQELLSDFLDGALSREDRATLSAHLEECLSCLAVQTELHSILSVCHECRGEYVAPPNERALWLRIRNTIEGERATAAAAIGQRAQATRGESWWKQWTSRSWELSFSQMMGAVAVISIAVALITAFSMQRMQRAALDTTSASASTSRAGLTPLVSSAVSASDVDDRIRQQQLAIEYWNQRIEERKALWSPQMREAFERNLNVIDQAVNYSRDELRRNPHDEVSEEMLNSALNDKMELLREFSDL